MTARRAPASALPRPLDLSYPSNRVALLGALGFTLAGRLSGRGWAQAARIGAAAFSAWSLGRELDPDDAGSANLALLLAGAAALERPPGLGELLSALSVTSAARVELASVGHAATGADALALSAAGGLAGALGDVGSALAPALALLASRAEGDGLGPPDFAPWLALSTAALGCLLGEGLGRGRPRATSWSGWGLALLALAAKGPALEPPAPHSRADQTGRPLSPSRLLGARAVTLAALALALLDGRPAHATPLTAAWAALGLRRGRAPNTLPAP